MNAPFSDGSVSSREESKLRRAMPRVLADVANFLARSKAAPAPAPASREIVLLFDSPAASYRAEELMKRLHHVENARASGVATVVSIHLQGDPPEMEIADSQQAGAEPRPLPHISHEMRGWFAERLAARHLADGFALILPLSEADPDPHVMEEAKLSAAVCHGLLRLFDVSQDAAADAVVAA